jgi:pyruvate,water dikinase
MLFEKPYIRWFEDVGISDVPSVGGKNASLGEMMRALKCQGIRVPDGFATTAAAYWDFLDANGLRKPMTELLEAYRRRQASLAETGAALRRLVLEAPLPPPLAEDVRRAYRELSRRLGGEPADVAVRSSATAEDLPGTSFAGQHETFLNVSGELAVLEAVRKCFASLFKDRAISYREQKGFDHGKIALSAGIQKMVRSDLSGSGVLFTLDTDTGFPRVVVINAVWGLGENIVQGVSTPDEYVVFKPLLNRTGLHPILSRSLGKKEKKMVYAAKGSRRLLNLTTTAAERSAWVLTDEEVLSLARWAAAIENHYGKPMDVEWAKDGKTGDIFIVQARPETVQARPGASVMKAYRLKETGEKILEGIAIGDAVAIGPVQIIRNPKEISRFREGAILVTGATDPDWVPIMKKAAGIVTDHGGRTSHAAIVSRELGIPALVGAGRGTSLLKEGEEITLSCAEGERGFVYKGRLAFEAREVPAEAWPETRTQIMVNLATPETAFRWWRLPARGVGLARIEFIINDIIKIHPMALTRFESLTDERVIKSINRLTAGFADKTEFFVHHLAQGIAKIAASRWPHPVIVRLSDFKTNEYANLIGGKLFEPKEENPMLGFRGASRYYNEKYKDGFALECRALKRVREEIGLDNVVAMVPFCRTLEEADKVLAVMADNGLRRGEKGLKVYVMCEIPSNVILAEEFAERFDGFSIGSNDLTQLVLGVDRDSADLAEIFDERNEAVKRMIRQVISAAHRKGRKVGICGQAPSDHPEFAGFLVECGIDSISLNPDSVADVLRLVAEKERVSAGAELTVI